ncbi:MAG: glycosyltransferase family 4 protein [Leptospiraceae bacterium]|nr:glycosyltransferase family 4 protein [Leptospiraceae bacterium]
MEKEIKLKPRIGIDARPLSYGFTGNSRYLADVLVHLTKNTNFEYFLYSNKPIHSVFNYLLNDYPLHLRKIVNYPGVVWLNFLLPGILKKDRIDIFWGTIQLLPMFKLNIPTVVNYHDLNFVSAPSTMTKLNYLQHRMLSRFTLKNADKIFCLSKNTYNDIKKYKPKYEEKLRVIYPGANRPSYKPETLPHKDFIFTVGTLEPRKNISTLLKAYLLVKEDFPNFPYSLIIAGRMGWGDPTLGEDLKSGKYKKQGIEFVESPSDEQLLFLYKNCKYFVFPSLHEGFGLPLIEAMVENKPCIGSDIPVFREILQEENDLYVNPKDVEGWKYAMIQMAEKKKFHRDPPCTENDWNWKKTSSEIEEEIVNIWKKRVKESSYAI